MDDAAKNTSLSAGAAEIAKKDADQALSDLKKKQDELDAKSKTILTNLENVSKEAKSVDNAAPQTGANTPGSAAPKTN